MGSFQGEGNYIVGLLERESYRPEALFMIENAEVLLSIFLFFKYRF
jgi:hypothetical protein